ncbi:MAG: hypothetical protein DWQ08_06255, partial [Proteobacteria bacterium]
MIGRDPIIFGKTAYLAMRHDNSILGIPGLDRLKSLIFVAVLPLAACATISPEPATIAEPAGDFSQSGEVPLQSHWWMSLPDPQLDAL